MEFLRNNRVYQNLLCSEVQFLEHNENFQSDFLTNNYRFIEIYLDFYHFKRVDLDRKTLIEYLIFLDKYDYSDEDFILVLMQYKIDFKINEGVDERLFLLYSHFTNIELKFHDSIFFIQCCRHRYSRLVEKALPFQSPSNVKIGMYFLGK